MKRIYKSSGLSELLTQIAGCIYNSLPEDHKKNDVRNYLTDLTWQKSVNLLNNILLNFQANTRAVGPEVLVETKDKLNSDIIEGSNCSFCGKQNFKRLTRDVFFFAPAQYNISWFNEPNLFICPSCLVSNLAITQAFTFIGNKQDAIVIYTPNLQDMEQLNSTINSVFSSNSNSYELGKILKPIIEYEKPKLQPEVTVKELQIFYFKLDFKNPLMEMFILTHSSILRLINIEDELGNLFNDNKIKYLFAYVKQKNKYINYQKNC
ncbi:MAG: hypothetical protein N2505_06405 [Endomicrobia bacterium]|nr:hypothetical protein [Endomicrobiia bacterium]